MNTAEPAIDAAQAQPIFGAVEHLLADPGQLELAVWKRPWFMAIGAQHQQRRRRRRQRPRALDEHHVGDVKAALAVMHPRKSASEIRRTVDGVLHHALLALRQAVGVGWKL